MHTAWLSGDDIAHINAVTLRQAWLVLRWVTMSGSLLVWDIYLGM